MQPRTNHYIFGLLLVVLLIAFLAFAGKRALAPSETPSNAVSSDASSGAAQPPSQQASSYLTIHVKRGGPTVWWSAPTTTVSSEIQLSNPPLNTTAVSPMSVSGNARGSWFFEGSMPIFLTDSKGKILAQGIVKAQSDWMTEDFVPFLGSLSFPRQPTGSNGAFVIKNDNPSGMASKDKRMEVLVTFN